MKKTKKIVAVIMAFVFIFSTFGFTTYATEEQPSLSIAYTENFNDEKLWELYAPYWAILEAYNEKYLFDWGFAFEHPSTIEGGRESAILSMSHGLEEFEISIREHVESLRGLANINAVTEAAMEAYLTGEIQHDEFAALIEATDAARISHEASIALGDAFEKKGLEIEDLIDAIVPFTQHTTHHVTQSVFFWNGITVHSENVYLRWFDGANSGTNYSRWVRSWITGSPPSPQT